MKVGLEVSVGVGVGVKVGVNVGGGEGLGVGVKVGTGVGVAKVMTASSGAAKSGRDSQSGSRLKTARPMTARTTKIKQPRIEIWLRIGFIPAIINRSDRMSKADWTSGGLEGVFRIQGKSKNYVQGTWSGQVQPYPTLALRQGSPCLPQRPLAP